MNYPVVQKHPYGELENNKKSLNQLIKDLKIDASVDEVDWIDPGEYAVNHKLKR